LASLAERRWLRLFTLCALYVAQGIPWGFMATTLPGYLTSRGVDAAIVGAMLSFTTLPYAFKWVWGPIIDAVQLPRFGRRRPWIIFAQSMMALTLIALVTFDLGAEIKLLTWTILIHTVFNSMQDVAVDALAVDLLPENERGRANGLMFACKYFGGIAGGAGVAKLIAHTSLNTALVVQTIILGVIMLVPLLVKERAGETPPRERGLPTALAQAFSLRSTIVAVLLMLSANFAIGVAGATGYPLFIGKLHWTYDDLAVLTGGWGLAVGGACAAVTGFFLDRFGRRAVAAFASCMLALGWLAFSLLSDYWTSKTLVYVSGFYEAAWVGVWSVSLISLCMDLSWPRVAGSQFTAYMALSNFSTTLGYQYSATLNKWWSFEHVYIAIAVVQLAVTLLLIPIDPHETRAKLPLPRLNVVGLVALFALLAFLIYMTVQKTRALVG
jgi:MFS transporter, PAT family, beta-lactamase induction signal transducer AmpG